MSNSFSTPAEAEDAYYDAIDERDLEKMMSVWSPSPDAACLLPMQSLQRGPQAIREMWRQMLDQAQGLDITINHMQWIDLGDVSIHLLEELATVKGGGKQPPIYASNTYHRDGDGWRLLLHFNSPTPPPPGMMPPLG